MDLDYPKDLTILSLDMATTTGWALLKGGKVTFGTFTVKRTKGLKTRPDEHEGVEYLQFLRWINRQFEKHAPSKVVAEESAGHWKSVIAARKPLGMRAFLMAAAACYNTPVSLYTASQVKKYATGKGNAKKPAMIASARQRYGVSVEDHNASDALHVLHYELAVTHGFEVSLIQSNTESRNPETTKGDL